MSDQQALDSFGFDIRWRYALDAGDDDAYISRRSLVEFRRRLAACDPKMTLVRSVFNNISKAAINKLGISTSDQRVDSTLVISNICTRGRLEWKQQYKIRAGIEATMSELKRSHGMGRLRVRRAPKVSFAVACKVIACNIKRWAKAAVASGHSLVLFCCHILAFLSPVEIFKERFKSIFECFKLFDVEVNMITETGT